VARSRSATDTNDKLTEKAGFKPAFFVQENLS
jgi:hypothetical protein